MKRKSDMAKRMSVGLAVFCAVLLTGCGAPGEKDEEQKIEQETEQEAGQEAGQTEQQSHVDNAEADAEGENLVSVIESDESRETDGMGEETDGNEEAVAKPEPKARPEGFELVLESEDWGLENRKPSPEEMRRQRILHGITLIIWETIAKRCFILPLTADMKTAIQSLFWMP